MSDYIVTSRGLFPVKKGFSNQLMHYAKGSTAKDHKYIKREYRNGKWRYTYTDTSKKNEIQNQIQDRIGIDYDNEWSGQFDQSLVTDLVNKTAELEYTDDPRRQQQLERQIDAGIEYIKKLEEENHNAYNSGKPYKRK